MFVSKIVGFNKFSIYGSSILLRHLLDKTKTPQPYDYGVTVVDDTRLELADAAAGGVHSRRSVRAKPGLKRSQVRVRSYEQNKNSAVKRLRSCCGGRYKTRTCDLPHVKRMRYQLRQSSISLSAGDILYQSKGNVKNFFRRNWMFFAAKAQLMHIRRGRHRY